MSDIEKRLADAQEIAKTKPARAEATYKEILGAPLPPREFTPGPDTGMRLQHSQRTRMRPQERAQSSCGTRRPRS